MSDPWVEEQRVIGVVRAHPYQSGMEPVAYIEMIAVLAGLLPAKDTVLQKRRVIVVKPERSEEKAEVS